MWRILFLLALLSFALAGPAAAEGVSLAAAARAQQGLPGLRPDPVLLRAAQMQADHMAERGRIGHDGPGGMSLVARARAVGHRPCYLAENVASGQRSAARVTRDWLRSPGHRANILNPRHDRAALAWARGRNGRLYWAMVLAGPCRGP
ncbi:CAP domain-containing protein [Jannaschia formosa]|uniref:CAP domain-containing protein n=1 Tax=Jannaschia formosa TaxID=2259592 RepID=UPI000E1B7813|nr:CAP domain-containing protein [Jannaschia formosa]TFL19855.1 CAP domain-containing protein [Jannaschia formosa]